MDNDNIYLELKKALDTSTTNGNNLLSPILLSTIISETVRRMPVLRNFIQRSPFDGQIYEWDKTLDPGTAQSAVDGATLAWSDAKFGIGIAKSSYYYYLMAISGPAVKATQKLLDIVQLRTRQAITAMARFEGSQLYAGDPVNPFNPGLNAVLSAAPTQSLVGASNILSAGFLSSIDISQRAAGFPADVVIVTPGIFAFLAQCAYDKVRFIGVDNAIEIGFSLSPAKGLTFNGLPVIMDPYAGTYTTKTAAMVATTGNNYKFADPNVQRVSGGNFAGTTWAVPSVTVSSVTVPASAYTVQSDGSYTFNSAPGATPQATYTTMSDCAYFLSLQPEDLVVMESEAVNVVQDIGKPAVVDAFYMRAQQYSALVVRNEWAHVYVPNIVIPANVSLF